MRVLRFGPNGSALDDLSSPEQERYIAELENQASLFGALSLFAWILFLVLLTGGMVYGVIRELRRVNAQKPATASSGTTPQADTEKPTWGDSSVEWLGRPRFDLFAIVVGLVVIAIISLGFIDAGADEKSSCSGMNMIWFMTVMISMAVIVPLVIARRRLKNTHIGVRDEWVIVRFPDGGTEMARDRDLLEVNNGFIINQRKVSLGNQQHTLYDKKDIEALLKPRLAVAKTMGPIEHMRWEWQHNKRTALLVSAASVILLTAALMLELGYGDVWLRDKMSNSDSPECQKDIN